MAKARAATILGPMSKTTPSARAAALRSSLLVLAIPVLLGLAACADSPTEGERLEGMPAAINERFLDPELSIDPWVGRWEGESREIFRYRHRIAEACGLGRGMAVADVGCGTGLFEKLFADRVGPFGRVYAIDISLPFLKHVAEKAAKHGLTQIETRLGSQRSIRLEPASVDLAFVCDVYHHFEDPPAILESIRSAIRPGGRLVLVDFRRIPGLSSAFILEHCRAGQEVFRAEVERAGFIHEETPAVDGLKDNYLMQFRRP